MALVRVYCGVAAAEMAPWLTVAVVDDSGRLLDMRHISDDPAGYAYLGALLADRSGGAAPVAMDRHDHLVAQLLAAANRPLAIADEASLADFADRFSDDTSYEETQAPLSQRAAVGLARALQAGALYATAQSPSWNLDEFKPVLAAHAAVTAGRQAAAAALREVLRELYPAALRAYPDPAEYVPLKILEALPEPSLLTASPSSRNREAALVAELSATGVADTTTAVAAITALRVAVQESPRWHTNRALSPVVAETVKQSVAAVRACDSASAALIGTLVERLGALSGGTPAPSRPYLVHPAPAAADQSAPAIPRHGPAAEVPPSRLSRRSSAASAAAAGVPAPAMSIPSQRGAADQGDPAAYGQPQSRAPLPQPSLSQLSGSQRSGSQLSGSQLSGSQLSESEFSESQSGGYPEYQGSSLHEPPFQDPTPFQEAPPFQPGPGYPGHQDAAAYSGRHDGPAHADPRYEEPPRHPDPRFAEPGYSQPAYAEPGYSERGYSEPGYAEPSHAGPGYSQPPAGRRANGNDRASGSYAQVGPTGPGAGGSWPADGGTGSWPPVEGSGSWPAVDPADTEFAAVYAGLPASAGRSGADTAAHGAAFNLDPLTSPMRPATPPAPTGAGGQHSVESPALRLVDNSRLDPLTDPIGPTTPPALRVIDGGRHTEPPANPVTEDTDLLIFSETQSNSAWFILADADVPDDEAPTWGHLADEGWRVAEQLASPSVGMATTAGLPRRVPRANLVPGSADEPPRQLRIVRDPQSIAAHTSGYFRGWQRGQEIGGYAVGQRDRAAWEFNREQRARESEDQRARLS